MIWLRQTFLQPGPPQMFWGLIILFLSSLSVLQILRTQQWLCLRSLPVSTAAATRGYTWSSAVTSCRILCTASPAAWEWTLTSRRRTQTAASAEQRWWLRWQIAARRAVLATGESWTILQSPPFRRSKHKARKLCLLGWEFKKKSGSGIKVHIHYQLSLPLGMTDSACDGQQTLNYKEK